MGRRRALALLVMFLVIVVAGVLAGKALASSDFALAQFGSLIPGSGKQPEPSGNESGAPTGGAVPAGTSEHTGSPDKSGDQGGSQDDPDKPNFWIDVDISDQMVRVMEGDKMVKEMIASTGVEGHETPLGSFQIQNRGTWFFSEKYQQGAKYWVSFKDWGIYLFHSLAMDKDQKVIEEEAAKLGEPASHGCVRLAIEDAKWIYDNISERTKVEIHE